MILPTPQKFSTIRKTASQYICLLQEFRTKSGQRRMQGLPQREEVMPLTMPDTQAVMHRLEKLSEHLDWITEDVPEITKMIRGNQLPREVVLRTIGKMQRLLHTEFRQIREFSDISCVETGTGACVMRVIGQLFEAVGSIVIDDQNRIRMQLEPSDEATAVASGALNRAVEVINRELRAGRELLGDRNIGCEIKEPLTDEMIHAIRRSVRRLAPVEIDVKPVDRVDPKSREVA
jgi:hypothetical protein